MEGETIMLFSVMSVVCSRLMSFMFQNIIRGHCCPFNEFMKNRRATVPGCKWNSPISRDVIRQLAVFLSLFVLISAASPATVETAGAEDIEKSGKLKIALTQEERQWLKAHPVVELGIDPGFAPFESFDERGKYQGIAADYVELIEEMLSITMRVGTRLPWDRSNRKSQET